MKVLALALALWTAPTFAAEAPALTGTLAKIKNSGTIVIGHRESSIPFSFIDEKKNPIGYQIDLCLKIVDAIKSELAMPNLKIKFVQVTTKNRLDLVSDGTVDMECGSTTNNFTRQKQVAFSFTTFVTGTRLVAKKSLKIEEIENLAGRTLGAAGGTTNFKVADEHIKENKLNIKMIEFKETSECFEALEKGKIAAMAADDVLLAGFISKSKHPTDLDLVGRFLSYDPYGIMVRKDDSAMLRLMNMTLANIFRSGEIQKHYDKWFKPMKFPMSEMLKAAVQLQAFPM